MSVFVLDRSGNPLMPCSEKRARKLLGRDRARVHRVWPFVIRLVDRQAADCALQPVEVKLDPGSKVTGLALVRKNEVVNPATGEIQTEVAVCNLFELIHRGRQISETLAYRSSLRRGRRGRNLRYRRPGWNDTKPEGWLAPSLRHRVETTTAWVSRLRRWAPVTSIAQELVRFDLQKLESPDISGVGYQQGTLAGYEVREYLLEKFGRECVYCDADNVPLNIDHVHPRSKGGTNRISNLALSCIPCNLKKGGRPIEDFLAHDPKRLAKIQAQLKRPLKDAAAVNTTRWALFEALKATGLPVSAASGGRTKFNRHVLGVPKTHALDAACVGTVDAISDWRRPTLGIKCTGRGSYQRTRLNKGGGVRGYLTRRKRLFGFQTGDLVMATVPDGKKAGIHIGRVAVRASGSFNIQKSDAVVQGINHKHCRLIQRGDGYGYSISPSLSSNPETRLPPPAKAAGYPAGEAL